MAKSNPQKDRKDFGVGTYWGVVYQFITVNLRIEVYTSLSPKKWNQILCNSTTLSLDHKFQIQRSFGVAINVLFGSLDYPVGPGSSEMPARHWSSSPRWPSPQIGGFFVNEGNVPKHRCGPK